jgi:hypothetical protein
MEPETSKFSNQLSAYRLPFEFANLHWPHLKGF